MLNLREQYGLGDIAQKACHNLSVVFRRADITLWETIIALCAVARGYSWCASLAATS